MSSEEMAERGAAVVPVKEYLSWLSDIDKGCGMKMTEDWGPPPGDINTTAGGIVIPGTVFGNVFIGIQPNRGYLGSDADIYHSQEVVAPHNYLAYYKWLEKVFKADAVIHMGCHGTLEWLPGKGTGLSRKCYPDLVLGHIPHIYPYIIDNPGEGIQAKRRSYCALIDHLIPSLTKSGSYDYLEELDELIKQYYHALQGDFGKLIDVENRIINLSIENNIHLDLKIDKKFMEESFEEFIEKLHGWIDEIKSSLIKDGLHIFGEVPSNERFDNLLIALLRLKNGEIPSLMEAICQGYGFDHDYLLDNPFEISNDGKTNIMILDELDELSREVIGEFGKEKYCIDKIDYT
jgi:cobaltochelatase CobN